MDELYREYLAYLRVERGSSPLTVSAYAADLKDYALFLKKRGIESPDVIDREVIVAYESDLFDRSYAASTVDRHVSVLKGFHRFLVREGYARRNPADTIQLPKAPDRLPDVLSVAQVDAMLSRPLDEGPLALRNQAILEVLYGCGLRVSECTGLDLGDAILEEGYLHIRNASPPSRAPRCARCATTSSADAPSSSARTRNQPRPCSSMRAAGG